MRRFEPKTTDYYQDCAERVRLKLTPPDSDTSIYGYWHYCYGINPKKMTDTPPYNMVITRACRTENEAVRQGAALKCTDLPTHVCLKGHKDGTPLTPREALMFIAVKRRGNMSNSAASNYVRENKPGVINNLKRRLKDAGF